MTDHVATLTVLLDRDYRVDDVQFIVSAILMIRGVQEVVPLVVDPNMYWIRENVRRELEDRIFEALKR